LLIIGIQKPAECGVSAPVPSERVAWEAPPC
jgi:hypothetical protein